MSLSEPDAVFLADRNLTMLFARPPDGSPADRLMTCTLTDDGLTFTTYAKPAKSRTCLAAGQATDLVVRAHPSPAAGTARLTQPPWPANVYLLLFS